jgi:hypothetical protein
MSGVLHERAVDSVQAAVVGLRAAATAATGLDYAGLAAELDDLAVVFCAVPASDADRLARALLSGRVAATRQLREEPSR